MITKSEQQHIVSVLREELRTVESNYDEIISWQRGEEHKITIVFSNFFIPQALIEIVMNVCKDEGVHWYISDTCPATMRYNLYIHIN